MSCHNIGYALNNISKSVIGLYDTQKLSKEDTITLLKTIRDSIGFCDGNKDEATECLENRCSICLEEKENLISYNNIPNNDPEIQKYIENYCYRELLTDRICIDCYKEANKKD